MLPSFRTGPVFVQKELYLIIFVGHLNLRQPKNSKSKRNISAINCRFCGLFDEEAGQCAISFEVSKSLAANICTFHCTVKVL